MAVEGRDALTSRPPNTFFLKLHFEFELAPGCYDFNNPPSFRVQSFSLYTSSSLSNTLPEGIIFLNRVEEKQGSGFGSYIDLKIYTGYLEVRKITQATAEVVFAEPQLTVNEETAFRSSVLDLISEEILAVLSESPPEVSLLDVWSTLPPESLLALQRSIAGDQITEFPITFPAPSRVPEPGTVVLLALGIAGLAFARRRRL